VQDADVLIVRSRTKVNQALLQDSQVKFVLNNHTTTRCINDNGLIANMMKILCIR
jgi:hypothetical protein